MAIQSPLDIGDGVLSLVVKVSGELFPSYYSQISLQIIHQLKGISAAELTFADGAADAGIFPLSDSEYFIPGNGIEIFAGYGGEAQHSIFSGIIVNQRIELKASGTSNLIVVCDQGNNLEVTDLNPGAEPILRLAFGESIISFSAELDPQLQSAEFVALKGNVSFQGNGSVRPGKLVQLERLGSRFSGKALVSSVIHVMEDGNWTTTAGFGK